MQSTWKRAPRPQKRATLTRVVAAATRHGGGTLRPHRPTRQRLPTLKPPLPPLTDLVGREREVAQVHALLSRVPVLTLTGAPGVGKSRLAVEVARRLGDHGAVIVCLGWVTDPEEVAPIVAQAVAGTGGTGPLEPGQQGDQPPLVFPPRTGHGLCGFLQASQFLELFRGLVPDGAMRAVLLG
jgi:hypothetical protein